MPILSECAYICRGIKIKEIVILIFCIGINSFGANNEIRGDLISLVEGLNISKYKNIQKSEATMGAVVYTMQFDACNVLQIHSVLVRNGENSFYHNSKLSTGKCYSDIFKCDKKRSNRMQYRDNTSEALKPPSDGRELIVNGTVFTSLGVLGIVSGLYVLNISSSSGESNNSMGYMGGGFGDFGISKYLITGGIISGAAGIAMLVIGKNKREEYLLWKSQSNSLKMYYHEKLFVFIF